MNVTVLKQSSAKTLNLIIDFIFRAYVGFLITFGIGHLIYTAYILLLIHFDENYHTKEPIPFPSILALGIAIIFTFLIKTNFAKKIFNGIFCLYTGYFISYFSMTIIYLVFSKIRSSFDHSFSYHNITELPWILIAIATLIFGILLFVLLRYLNQKEYIKIKTPDYAYKIIYMLLLPSCLFYILLSILSQILCFKENIFWWNLRYFLPIVAFLSIYINKYLSGLLTIVSSVQASILFYLLAKLPIYTLHHIINCRI